MKANFAVAACTASASDRGLYCTILSAFRNVARCRLIDSCPSKLSLTSRVQQHRVDMATCAERPAKLLALKAAKAGPGKPQVGLKQTRRGQMNIASLQRTEDLYDVVDRNTVWAIDEVTARFRRA
jgi:hypothetical protein